MAPKRVRLVGDAGTVGVATGEVRPLGGVEHCKVVFPTGYRWVSRDQLEAIPENPETPIEHLEEGRLGGVRDLRRTLVHVRLRGRLADLFYSMESTNTDFYAYQFKPVLKLLACPAKGVLIADEVGLGKTIEAGLIWTELRSRFNYRRLVVLCPAVLRDKWQAELRTRFGVRAEQVDAARLAEYLEEELTQQSREGFALIASYQGLRPESDWRSTDTPSNRAKLARLLQEHEYEDRAVDLLIMDEAHYLRNPETRSHELGAIFAKAAEHVVMLSATPIHLRNADLFFLLRVLDPDTFNRTDLFDSILEANAPLVAARDLVLGREPDLDRMRELVQIARRNPLLEGNRQLAGIEELLVQSTSLEDRETRSRLAYQLETANLLGHVFSRTRKRDVTEWRVVREPVPQSIPMSAVEREFYETVTQVVRGYCEERQVNENFLLVTPQRQASSCMPAALAEWKRLEISDPDDDSLDPDEVEALLASVGPLKRTLIEHADEFTSIVELEANDTKFHRVQEVLSEHFREHPESKVVMFSTFRSTLAYLKRRLEQVGISCAVMHGSIPVSKSEVISTFRDDARLRVLLSSEVGSEGVDLQFCSRLINYDLPWNPMRVEQRIGRIDRIGQLAQKVTIWNLFYEDTIDDRIYRKLYDRLDLCRHALGDFEAVLGQEFRRLTHDLLREQLTAWQENERIEQTSQAIENLRQEEDRLEQDSSQFTAYGDYILQQVQAARSLHRWITPDEVQAYVLDFFQVEYPDTRIALSSDKRNEAEFSLCQSAFAAFGDFVRSNRLPLKSALLTQARRPVRVVFSGRVVTSESQRIETISHHHPLVAFVAEKTEQQSLSLRPAVALRVTKSKLPPGIAEGVYQFAIKTWFVEGLQVSEKLGFSSSRLDAPETLLPDDDSERLVLTAAMEGEDWIDWRDSIDMGMVSAAISTQLVRSLYQRSSDFQRDRQNENEDRIEIQLKTLKTHLSQQREQLHRIARDHRAANRESLARATDARLEIVEQALQARIRRIEQHRNLRQGSEDISVGLIRVEAA